MKKIAMQLLNKERVRNSILLALAAGIVMVVALWGIEEHLSITIFGDEFGYWQGAAFFAGKDWSEIGATNGYYAFGYGLLLAPIMAIWGNDSVAMFHGALILNAVLLASCVYAAYFVVGYFMDSINSFLRVVIALLAVLYPSNVVFAVTTLSEILLTALTWWYFVLAIKFIEEQKLIQAVGLAALSVCMYTAHHRCISVIVISVALIVWIYRKVLLTRKVLVPIVVLLLIFFLFKCLKNEYVSSMYRASNSNEMESIINNDVLGELAVVKGIFSSWEVFKSTCYSLVGKAYYISVATAGLIIFSFLYCIKLLKKGQESLMEGRTLSALVICVFFFIAFAIDVVKMYAGFDTRIDRMLYGRYMEYAVGPMLVLAVAYLFIMLDVKEVFASLSFVAGTTVFTAMVFPAGAPTSHLFWNCSAIATLFPKDSVANLDSGLFEAFLRSAILLGVVLIAFQLRRYFRNIGIIIAFICMIITWIAIGSEIREDKFLIWPNKVYTQHESILSVIGEEEFGVYDAYMGAFFQFQRVNANMHVYDSLEQIEALEGEMYIITANSSEMKAEIQGSYEVIHETGYNFLWKKRDM